MLLHRTGLIELEYDMAHDTLCFAWPDLKDVEMHEIEHSFLRLLESIKHYDIKRLFIDSRNSKVDMNEQQFHDLILEFSRYFLDTRLEKIARLASLDPEKERRTDNISGELSMTVNSGILYRNFHDAESAQSWLRG